MKDKIKRWIVDHPYFLTSAVFLVILFVGWRFLYWRDENFAFLLLMYFIVTLGIRLDDISRKIGFRPANAASNPNSHASVMQQLNDIKRVLLSINATLNKILEKTARGTQQACIPLRLRTTGVLSQQPVPGMRSAVGL